MQTFQHQAGSQLFKGRYEKEPCARFRRARTTWAVQAAWQEKGGWGSAPTQWAMALLPQSPAHTSRIRLRDGRHGRGSNLRRERRCSCYQDWMNPTLASAGSRRRSARHCLQPQTDNRYPPLPRRTGAATTLQRGSAESASSGPEPTETFGEHQARTCTRSTQMRMPLVSGLCLHRSQALQDAAGRDCMLSRTTLT